MSSPLFMLLLQWSLQFLLSSASTAEDIRSLRDFATKIGLDRDYWNFSTEPCSGKWKGISCCTPENLQTECCLRKFWPADASCSDSPNGTIVALNLDYNVPFNTARLTGFVSETVCNLTSLVMLDLNNNFVSGSIPACIGENLLRLRYLGISSGNLTGSLPEQLGNLASLKELQLDNTALSGNIPPSLGRLQSLEFLFLRGNKLSGPIPPELGRLSNLTDLRLQVNLLDGTIPDSFANLTKLKTLTLFNNRLSGTLNLSTFRPMTSLNTLDVHTNSFTGPVPAFDDKFAFLTRLDLSFNKLSGEVPASLGRLVAIRLLFLGHNNLSGSLPSSINSLKNLTALDVSHNSLTGSFNLSLPPTAAINFAFNSFDIPRQELSYFNCLPGPQQTHLSSCSRSRPGKVHKFAFQAGATTTMPTGFQADSQLHSTGFSYFGPENSWASEAYGELAGTFYSRPLSGESDELFRSMRWSSTYLAYHGSNLRPGVYKVTLYFAETTLAFPDYRVFNVSIQGTVVEQDLDVVRRVGPYTGLTIIKNATVVQDGGLSIEFVNTGKDRYLEPRRMPLGSPRSSGPMVSAISVSLLNGSMDKSSLSWKWITVIVLVGTLVAVMTLLGWYRYARLKKLSRVSRFQGLRVYKFKELSDATDGFSDKNKLGQGGFGKVYLGTVKGNHIAVKQLITQTPQSKQSFEKEMEVLQSIQHKNLLAIRGFCADFRSPMLVCDYMQNGSLEKLLYNGKLTWEQRQRIAVESALGLTYLHEESKVKIVHCDVKPANILLDDEMSPRIGDFGMARLMGEEISHVTATRMGGTIGYLAPEYAMHCQISDKVDVYGFGIVLLELVSGRRPLETQGELVLVEWAHSLAAVSMEQLSVIIDPGMEGNCPKEEAIIMAAIGVHCTQEAPSARPGMRAVWLMLSGTLDVPALRTSTTLEQNPLKALIAAYTRQPSRGNDSNLSSPPAWSRSIAGRP